MLALLPVGDGEVEAANGRLIEEAAFGEPLCLIAPAKVIKRGYIARPLIINAGASTVKEASIGS
jgi:hypothetical protein